MWVSIEKIASDVATLLGEPFARECHPAEAPYPDLSVQILLRSTICLSSLLLEASHELIDRWESIPGELMADGDGSASLPLPEDFLIFGGLKLRGWSCPVTMPAPPDGKKRIMQLSPWPGIHGNPCRPAVFLEADNEGRHLRIYGYIPGDTMEYALYLPVPEVKEGMLNVPPALYPVLLRKLRDEIED